MRNENIINQYLKLKEAGASPQEVFAKAKADGLKNFDCIYLLMVIFEMSGMTPI